MRHVMGHNIIGNAADMYKFCCTKVAQEPKPVVKPGQEPYISIREFVFVDGNDVQRDRSIRADVQTLVGTRKLHAVQTTSTTLKLLTRNLSCYCPFCAMGDSSKCSNREFIGPWEARHMRLSSTVKAPVGKVTQESPPLTTLTTGDRLAADCIHCISGIQICCCFCSHI